MDPTELFSNLYTCACLPTAHHTCMIHAHMCIHTYPRTNVCILTPTHTCTHTCTHAHSHTPWCPCQRQLSRAFYYPVTLRLKLRTLDLLSKLFAQPATPQSSEHAFVCSLGTLCVLANLLLSRMPSLGCSGESSKVRCRSRQKPYTHPTPHPLPKA